jgi:hypothetical protein
MSGPGEFAGNWLREAELGLELSRSRVRLGASVLILILQIKQSTTCDACKPEGLLRSR